MYNPANGVWTFVASMPFGVNHAAYATDGRHMYIFGGRRGGNDVSDGFDHIQVGWGEGQKSQRRGGGAAWPLCCR